MANKSFVIQYLIKARDQFSVAAEKTRKSIRKMRVELDKARKAAKKFGKDTSAMFTSMRNKGAIATIAMVFMARSLKNAARDAEETRSKFATVFKDIAGGAETAAVNLAKNFGLASTVSKKLLGDTGDLLTGFGFTQKEALKLSVQVNELAVDLASFTNFSGGAEGASAALTKALLGERESLKTLGVAILEKDVKVKISELLSKGQRFSTLRQAKAHATLALAIEQSKNAIGDFSRTQGELANQERITSARIQDLKESFGRFLMPAALKLTKAIRSLVAGLQNLSPAGKKIVIILAAIVAAIGPLLLIVGSIGLALPVLTAGFATLGIVSLAALGPVTLIALALAAVAVVVVRNWDKVKNFFTRFGDALRATVGPAVRRLLGLFKNVARTVTTLAGPPIAKLVSSFKKAASTIAALFGPDSELFRRFTDFGNLGQFIGEVVGGTLDVILRGLAGIGAIIGQVIGAVTNLDFSQFDIESIKAEFLGAQAQPLLVQSRIDVGVNVGLDAGLTQTSVADVTGSGVRRTDVGALPQ